MLCARCQTSLPEDAKFCTQCGAAVLDNDELDDIYDMLEALAAGYVDEEEPAETAATADPTQLYGIRPVRPETVQDLPAEMERNFYFVPTAKGFLNELVTGTFGEPGAALLAQVEQAYEEARAENRFLIKPGKNRETNYVFLLSHTLTGAPCDITCYIERNLHVVGTSERFTVKRFSKASPTECYPRLEQFAYLGNLAYTNNIYHQLAEKALCDGESWQLDEHNRFAGQKQLDSLRNYLQYTFLRLAQTEKVMFSEQKDFASFNTGLVDALYNPLFACFVRNEREAATGVAWKFDCVSAAEQNEALRTKLPHLPKRATYIDKLDDVLFNTKENGTVRLSNMHILSDNVNRLPMAFLRRYLTDAPLVALLDQIDNTPESGRAPLYSQLRNALKNPAHSYCLRDMYNRFQSAVTQAELRAEWNYKTAVPCYFPTTGQLSLMLPLCLTNDRDADVALVVERESEENYIGRTILTLEMAYLDARLICRPESDWLRASSIR